MGRGFVAECECRNAGYLSWHYSDMFGVVSHSVAAQTPKNSKARRGDSKVIFFRVPENPVF